MAALPEYIGLMVRKQIPGIVPWYLVAGLVKWESSFNRLAVSPAGAWGLGQAMIGTWDRYGKGSPTNPSDMLDFIVSYLEVVAYTLAPLGRATMRWVVYGYSAGPGNAQRARDWNDTIPEYRAHAERVERSALEYKAMFGDLNP